jgi:tetratricopeptide (TPR) repeat protein
MYNLSILYYKLERYDDAIMTLKRYIEKTSRLETLKAELSLAIILFVQGKSHEAVKAIKKLILIHPSNIMLRYNLNLFLQRSS